ncbi:MAG: HEAT repeat domain-containing protein [Rhodospirillales bacterium]|nr:HEAT repeat domain-containing protein [Rhodospirillales bacterium]
MIERRIPVLWLALALVLACAGPAATQERVETAGRVRSLMEQLNQNVGLRGSITRRLEAQEALIGLGLRDPGAVVPPVVAELQRSSGRGRRVRDYHTALIVVLQQMGEAAQDAAPVLTEIVQDSDPRNDWLRFAAQGALQAIGTREAEEASQRAAETTMVDWLATASSEEVARVVRRNGYLIRKELRTPRLNEELIEPAARNILAIGRRAEAAAPDLLRAYGDPRVGAELRALLGRALGALGIDDPTAAEAPETADRLEAIVADSKDDDPFIRDLALQELERLGPGEAVIDALIDALRENRGAATAALVLGRLGPAAGRAAPDLLPYLRDPGAGANAIHALGQLRVRDQEIIDALTALLAEADSPQRAMAAAALGELDAVAAVSQLADALSAEDKYTRLLAARSLGGMGVQAGAAVPALTALLEGSDVDLRRAGVEALGSIGAPARKAVPLIARQLQAANPRLKASATLALQRIGGAAAETALRTDARRYEVSDRAEYERLRASGKAEPALRFLDALPEARQLQLARTMLGESAAVLAYAGCGVLIQAGYEEETLPTLARLIAGGQAERDLGGRIGWDWLHADDPGLFSRMTGRLGAYLEANLERYGGEERRRVQAFLDRLNGQE